MHRLILYTKLDCRLCEEAYRVLLEIINDVPLKIEVIDVTQAHNKDIVATYGDRIPVIARPEIQTELDWPFTSDDLRAYLMN